MKTNWKTTALGIVTILTSLGTLAKSFLEEGHTVLVHCHGGRSRTGLILKAWKMKKEGWSGTDGEQRAHMWLSQKWNLYTNTHFRDYLINM